MSRARFIRFALSARAASQTDPRITMRLAAKAAAENAGVRLSDILGPQRQHKVAHARQGAMAALYDTGRFSLAQIGDFFHRDHTTVIHGIKAHRARCSQ